MRVNLLITMIIFALIWPVTALRAAVSKTTWADAPAREFVFVENNSDDNFFVTPGGALKPRGREAQPAGNSAMMDALAAA
ncbi:hypothetical protein ACVWC9_12700, partial [Escherichia coli]